MSNKSIQQTLQLVKQLCQQRDFNLTTKRSNVLRLMLVAEKALSAYDIVDRYAVQYHQKISAVSVYRMLDFLIKAGLVHKLSSNSQYIVCSHIGCTHTHKMPMLLICDDCHGVEEVEIGNSLPPTLKKNMASTGFQLHDKQLELHGICLACQNL
jgi:Fur family zinc uptake transcriptional regulator